MVNGKNVKFSCEKSPSPKRFVEPEGMTDVDLRRLSQLSGFSEASFKKFEQQNARKNLCKILSIFCILAMLVCGLFVVVNRVQLPWRSWKTNMLVSEYLDRFERCKLERTLEACCSLMGENDILEDCTVEKFLDISKKIQAKNLPLEKKKPENAPGFIQELWGEDSRNFDENLEKLPDFLQKNWDEKADGNIFVWEENGRDEKNVENLADFFRNSRGKTADEKNIENSPVSLRDIWEEKTRIDENPVFLGNIRGENFDEKNLENLPVSLQNIWDEKVDEKNLGKLPGFLQDMLDRALDSLEDPYGEGVDSFGEDESIQGKFFEKTKSFAQIKAAPSKENIDEHSTKSTVNLDKENNVNKPSTQSIINLDKVGSKKNELNVAPIYALKIGTKIEDTKTPIINNTDVKLNLENATVRVKYLLKSKAKRQIPQQYRVYIPRDNYGRENFDWSPQPGIDWYNAPKRTNFYKPGPFLERNNFRTNREEQQFPRDNRFFEQPQQFLHEKPVGKKYALQFTDSTSSSFPQKQYENSKYEAQKHVENSQAQSLREQQVELPESTVGPTVTHSNRLIIDKFETTPDNLAKTTEKFVHSNKTTEINPTEEIQVLETDNKLDQLSARTPIDDSITLPNNQTTFTTNNSQNVSTDEKIGSNLFSARINEGTKLVQFGSTNDQGIQSQQTQCVPSYSPPVGASMPLIQQQVPFAYDSNAKFAQMIPISAAKSNQMWSPQYYVAQTVPQQYPFAQTPTSTGQYFICNPIQPQTNNIAGMPGVEVRQSNFILSSTNSRSLLRESTLCAFGQKMCGDASKCLKKEKICDGEINCSDGSDEAFCSCRIRVGDRRICDGYYDCPNGEDEVECYGCDESSFNCDDWSYSRSATCVPFEKRCDGIPDCPTGKDEMECTVLLDSVESSDDWLKISSSSGFLHRNFKGKWYPACSKSQSWATEVCKTQTGPNVFPPLIHTMNIESPYFGAYADLVSQHVEIVESCEDNNKAVYVECPPPTCGLRKIERNPYRNEEVDTSEEEILARFRHTREANGTDDVLGGGRVVGGKPCQPGAWPWVVSIYKNGAFHCGGALISESWIVTAAHCVEKYWMYYYEVEIGMLRRFSYSPIQQTRHVSVVVRHAEYDRANLKNDLAIMKLNYPVKYNQYVRPICLPTQYTAGVNYGEGPSPGTVCTAVGWGATVEHGSDPDQVREVEVPVLPICKHKEDAEGREICAGLSEGGKDACQGDSGGPFLCRNPNFSDQWYLAGVVSHGEGCARPNEPGVYTRVPLYRDWIYEHAKDDNLQQRQPLQRCPGYTCKVIGKCIPKAHRCDKVIDCLYGDDEVDCERRNSFTSLFKQAVRHIFVDELYRSNQEEEFDTTTETIPDQNNGTTRFLCKKMLEVIQIEKKCDKVIDCQDGSDEESCSCGDYLRISHPGAICDGVTDCADLSDERDCASCDSRSFHCRLSGACVPVEKKCDNRADCEHEEDEWDCVALSDALEVEVDNDGRPLMSSKGLVMISSKGEWRPLCGNFTGVEGQTAADVCVTLGFSDYESYLGLEVGNDSCSGLHVKCTDVRVAVHDEVGSDHNIAGELYNSPWNAAIYSDGEYVCSGTVLNPNWILTSINCFPGILKLHQHYVAVLLGSSKGELSVGGPHEQIIPVAQTIQVPQTDSCLLRLSTNLNTTRYVRPLNFQREGDFVRYHENCTASGRDEQQSSAIIHLSSIRNCSVGFRCFKRITAPPPECKVSGSRAWSGSVVCNSGSGFYPAATFYETTGICGFNQTTRVLNLASVKNRIITAMEEAPVDYNPPKCAGFRCRLGKCMANGKVCNGVSDCRDAEDESASACHLADNSVCPLDAMRCSNGRCVRKSSFCDRYDDCGDGSDEPDRCTCQAYLRLADPEKICDGVRNCLDRSDEDPDVCKCSAGEFHCGESSSCIPHDMVCDGHPDCPGSEDETHCYSLKSSEDNRNAGEVMTRTSGIWHPGCFPPKLSTTELEDICSKLGFTGNSAAYFNATVATAEKPVFDDFRLVWIHRKHSVRVNVILRNGDKPYVSFKEDPECYRLFIKCL